MENKKQKENMPSIPDTLVSYVTGVSLETVRAYKYGKRPDKVGYEGAKREIKIMLAKMRARKITQEKEQ